MTDAAGAEADDWIYWTGCAANYDRRIGLVVAATVKVLRAGGMRLRFLGREEACTGDAARRLGEEGLFQQLALQNIETLTRHRARRIVTHCAHCYHTLKNEYPRFGGAFEVRHHSEVIAELIGAGRIRLRREASLSVTLHDSCYVGRYNRIFEAPRRALGAALEVKEMPRHGDRSFCCGAGGANYWYDAKKTTTAGVLRMQEAKATGAKVVAAECPFCIKMLEQGAQALPPDETLTVRDIAEIVADSLEEPAVPDEPPTSE